MSTDTLLNPEQVAARLQVSEYTGSMAAARPHQRPQARQILAGKAEDLEAFINHPPTLRLVDAPADSPLTPPTPSAETPQGRKAALLARLQAMKGEGLSTQAIANRLNAEGVPTLSGRGQWQRGTVGNLLAEAEGTR